MPTPRGLAVLVLALALAGCSTPTTPDVGHGGDQSPEPVQVETSDEPTVQEDSPAAPADGAAAPADGAAADEDSATTHEDSSAALDAYVDAERATLDALGELELYSSIDVEADYPSTVRFSYVFAEQLDPTTTTAELEATAPLLQQVCDSAVFPAMEQLGVVGPAVTYVYYNADGTQLWTQDFIG